MKKRFLYKGILIFALVMFFVQEGFAKSKAKTITIATLAGPSSIPLLYMKENTTKIAGYTVLWQDCTDAKQELPKLLNGEVDIGFLPPNISAKVFNQTGKITNLGVCGNGMVYLITKDENLTALSQLKGKKIAVAGMGATPDYLFKYILQNNDIALDTVDLDFSIPNAQIAAMLLTGKVDYAVVPEPFATVACKKDPQVRRAFDLQQEYANIAKTTGDFPMTLMVGTQSFTSDKSSAKVIKALQQEYDKAQKWTKEHCKEAALLSQKYGLSLSSTVVESAIPNAAFVYETPLASRKRLEAFLSVFMQFDSTSVGEKLPGDAFYFN